MAAAFSINSGVFLWKIFGKGESGLEKKKR